MSTLKEWIEKEANGEAIEGIVIGDMGWGDYRSDRVPNYAEQPKNKLLSWEEAVPWISYEFDARYGAPGCNAITAWTKSLVIGISEYDGSTSIFSMPRNPIDHIPSMPGG